MDKFVEKDKDLKAMLGKRYVEYVRAPNQFEEGARNASRATSHGDFDDDKATVKATLARIVGSKELQAPLSFPRSSSSASDMRRNMR
jgi:hypothetical protein